MDSAKGILVDTYLNWTKAEGLPTYEDFCVDMTKVETAPWPRLNARGAFVHLNGRGDFISIFVMEIPPGASTSPQVHLYEEVFYVLSGHGTAVVEMPSGREHSFEWGPRSLFAFPLNARYRLFNGSGREPVRLASTNNLAMMLNTFRNESFIFDNSARFGEREGDDGYFSGEGTVLSNTRNRSLWETNLVPDLASFDLDKWSSRGAGSSNMVFSLAEGTLHAHCSEMSAGTYKKGHRHGADFHVCIVNGHGYSLFWCEGETDFRRYDWQEGCVFAPPDMVYHQHFNTSPKSARYLATAWGSTRFPFSQEKRLAKLGVDISSKLPGGRQIEYEDQDPRIQQMYLAALARRGVTCRMDEFLENGDVLKG